jgi:hypothetical protein
VTDELHLEQRVVNGHRVGRVLLHAHDVPGLVIVVSLSRCLGFGHAYAATR